MARPPGRESPFRRRLARAAPAVGLWVMWLAFSGTVGAGAVQGTDGAAARAVSAGAGGTLDAAAEGGALLFGLAAVAVLGTALASVLVVVRSRRVAVACVVALALAGLAERGVRAAFVQPADPSIRVAALRRAEQQPRTGGAATLRAELPGVAQPGTRHSYPSGHATLAGALLSSAVAGLMPRRRLGAIAGLLLGALAIWSGWAELYRGMHVLSDVFGGLLLGAAVVLTCLTPFVSCAQTAVLAT